MATLKIIQKIIHNNKVKVKTELEIVKRVLLDDFDFFVDLKTEFFRKCKHILKYWPL